MSRERGLSGYVRTAQQECVSFFFTNFPHTEDVVGLRKTFGSFGRIGDLFIPSKRTKFNQRFGFVRFRAVWDVDELLLKLQDIWLGTYKLRVNIAKFRRDNSTYLPQKSPSGVLVKHATPCDGRSVVVDISSDRLAFLEKCLVGYIKEGADLLTFTDSLVLHGLLDVSVHPMGGGLILISSKIEGLLLSLFAQGWWGAWFTKLERWSPNILSCRREVWLDVWGLPLQCWGVDVFAKIANSFVVFLKVYEIRLRQTSFVTGRVKVSLPVAASGGSGYKHWYVSGEGSEASEKGFSDAGNFENDHDEGPRFSQNEEGTDLQRLVDLEERDKSPLSSLGGLSCQQTFHDTNRFSPLYDVESEELEVDSERRRLVSVSCQNTRGEGVRMCSINSSNQKHNIRNENQFLRPTEHVSEDQDLCESAILPLDGSRHVALDTNNGIGDIGPTLIGPIPVANFNCDLVQGLEGGAIQQLVRLRLVDPSIERGCGLELEFDSNLILKDNCNAQTLYVEKGVDQHTPLRLPSSARSQRSSPSSFSTFLSDLPPETVISPPIYLKRRVSWPPNYKKPLMFPTSKDSCHLNFSPDRGDLEETMEICQAGDGLVDSPLLLHSDPGDKEEIESVEKGSHHFARSLLRGDDQTTTPTNFKKPLPLFSGDRLLDEGEQGNASLVRPALDGPSCSSLALCPNPGMTPTHFSVGIMLVNGEPMTPPEGIGVIQGINLGVHLEGSPIPCTRLSVSPKVFSSGSSSGV
ncbi:hypothetical protein TSUD_300390 [Trifolium subterraneum]|uniref:RRM domain-containing protein n=1 Tax=Trifolium subterraneum TaxID=3900 RepID=A0A2Z6P7P0_TRISU|nr:hypothetical protein TSUD_300390 [Trifolium subterraneum]